MNEDKYIQFIENIEEDIEKYLQEKWSQKYKRSIDCSHPKGFSQKAHCQGRKKHEESIEPEYLNEEFIDSLDEDLRKWFREKWVRFGPDGKIRGACARGKSSEGKPKCRPLASARAMGKKGRATAARRKRREDPNPERRGKAKNVKTK
jgi:hypothetical protein